LDTSQYSCSYSTSDKFGSHPDSIDLFTKLGAETYGRDGTGIMELIGGIALSSPSMELYLLLG